MKMNYKCRLCECFTKTEQSQSSFWVSLISSCFFRTLSVWFISECMTKEPGPETLYWARPLDTWYIEQCISKANIIMNWICVYVCGPTVDCLWRCPKSNTTLSRINTPPFSIPRSPEMKRSFFHNYHLRQSIAGGIGSVPAQPLSTQISSSVGCSHPSPTEIALNRRKMYITEVPTKNGIGLVRIQTPKPPPPHPHHHRNHRSSYKSLKRALTPMYGNTINIDVGESSSKAASVTEH